MAKGIFAFILLSACALRLDAQSDYAPPHGYLIERINVPTDRGVLVYPVGTRVNVLSEKDGKTTVEAQDRELVVENSQIAGDVVVVQRLQEGELALSKDKKDISSTAPTPGDKLRSLEKRGVFVKAEMDRANAEMHNTPHKNRPRTPEDRAFNERHDAWKR